MHDKYFSRLMRFYFASAVIAAGLLAAGCKEEVTGPDGYRVIAGCGEIFFKKKLGEDFASASAVFFADKEKTYTTSCPANPCKQIRMEARPLQVDFPVDNRQFFHLWLFDVNTNTLVESASSVIDAEGNLYHLVYCDD